MTLHSPALHRGIRRTGRDDYPPYDHRGVVVVASAWLAFYVIAATHAFIASGY
jgi:hypothetical protein